jgi:hypothetical protein
LSEDKKLTKLLEKLNSNIEILSKITALTFRKDSLFKDKDTKPEQIEELEEMKLPDELIALIIGSTAASVKAQRSQRKAKAKKTQAKEPKSVDVKEETKEEKAEQKNEQKLAEEKKSGEP